jgi:adenosylcobyric acid synthase
LAETRVAAIMIQGTGSGVGKSTLVAGLARAFTRQGLRVQPFKPQNMSNNAAVTAEGGEIGRAQALQARAARVAPSIHMNPVLLKPETDRGAQIIVQGRAIGRASAADYAKRKIELLPAVLESFRHLEKAADLVLIEGAGSPAEINLRANDIANMGFASAANLPVIIAGDIDRGGVIASLAGTHAVLNPEDRDRIKGFLINKFRGDPSLFQDGIAAIKQKTSWPCLGLIPWLPATANLPAEDSLDIKRAADAAKFKIAVPVLARIANFDDLDPLGLEPNVELIFVPAGTALPGNADLIILPGSKSTMGDLAFLREQGWDIDIAAHVRRGGHMLGLCGGYQMLGLTIEDPDGVDGTPGCIEGLGLLSVTTRMVAEKHTGPVSATHCLTGASVSGYEIHLGTTDGADCATPMLMIGARPDGATSPDGRVQGTYVHGLFTSDKFRKHWLAGFGIASDLAYETKVETALDALADHLEQHVDLDQILNIARSR